MVKIKVSSYIGSDGSINLEAWLSHVAGLRATQDINFIRHACILSQLAGENKPTLTGVSCLQQGLIMAEILLDIQADKDTIAAALIYNSVRYAEFNIDDVSEHLGTNVAKLVQGTIQMEAMRALPGLANDNTTQIENIRKMLLAMVQDMRVVLIKLAERTAVMRTLKVFETNKAKDFAKETLEIYAPLANRLGLGQLKWELEDLSLHYLEPKAYEDIAKHLDERRVERDQYINEVLKTLENALSKAHIKDFKIMGRAKHIYSIYRKMQKKKISFNQLFDLNALRVLVNTIDECYAVLSLVHSLWQPIASEFDDYIATPKPNGYRSIHTAVTTAERKNIEIQIRTYTMHNESELGGAAHWQYKEGAQQRADYQEKIAWLRQVLEWQRELAKVGAIPEQADTNILDDRVYVFTPAGEIVDLPQGSTPLDFAYHIHSEVGHRCRGAKINGNIVPLTYTLNTGEQIEILTAKQPNPSRDWLSSQLGYLNTARAKAKVHHWFKIQDYDKNLADGQTLFEREIQRLGIGEIDQEKLTQKLHYKNKKDMFAALGSGDLRLVQVLNVIQSLHQEQTKKTENIIEQSHDITLRAPTKTLPKGINVAGIGNLLTHTAKCCKPVPGDDAIGFITHGHGIAVHRKDCLHIINLNRDKKNRLVEISWGEKVSTHYPIDVNIQAHDRPGLLRDITTLIANEKLSVTAINSSSHLGENKAFISLTVEIPSLAVLSKLFDRIKHIPNIIDIKRQGTPN